MLMKKLLAELLGTFALVFAGTGAIVIDAASHGAIGHAGVALTFGLIVLAMIDTFGDVSGAHLNPAVTVAFAVAGRFAWREVAGYVLAQGFGALAASALLRSLFPADGTLGATIPAGPWGQSFVLEVVLTTDGSERKGDARRDHDWRGDRSGGDVCGPDLWRFDEPGPIPGAGGDERSFTGLVDLPFSADAGRVDRGATVHGGS